MLGTFVAESVLLLYVLLRYKMSLFVGIASMLIFSLSMFQLSEYMICKNGNWNLWIAIGFASITLLPVLGYHLVAIILNKKKLLIPLYLLTVTAIGFIVFSNNAIIDAKCSQNYLTFVAGNSLWGAYTIFYFGLLFLGSMRILGNVWNKRFKKYTRADKALLWIFVGYLSFLIPTGLVYIVSPEARHAIPSIMCGFAILLAMILAFKVLPNKEGR